MSTELATVPKELRIERRLTDTARANALTWLPVVILAPFAFLVEAIPAAIGILLVTGLTMREFRRSRVDVLPHLELADSGDIDTAIDRLAEIAKKERDWMRKSFLIGLLANLELRSGNRDTALALARESIRHPQKQRPMLRRSLEGGLAMILALEGAADEAEEWLPPQQGSDMVTDMDRMVVWARAGKWDEVANFQYRRLPEIAGLRHANRVMALLKAAALGHAGGGALKLQRMIDEARPRFADEYAYLAKDWPELTRFLDANPELKRARNILQRF